MIRQLWAWMVLWPVLLGAQQESPRYREWSQQFMGFFNAGQYDSIYARFDDTMKSQLTAEATRSLLEGQVRGTSGSIVSMEFSKLRGEAHIYKTTFERATLDLLFSMDGSGQLNGFYIQPHTPVAAAPILGRNQTPMALPLRGEWFVFWGGEDPALNYHMNSENQQYAYDLLKVAGGKSYAGDPLDNESYLAFGEPILAPCDGRVVLAIDGVPDNVPGDTNPVHLTGNTLVLETEAGEFIMLAHLREGSLAVAKGDQVRKGQVLAACGNSGNSTEPHLHLQLQNVRDFHKATGARLYFDNLLVNGQPKQDYMPVKEDFIQNSN